MRFRQISGEAYRANLVGLGMSDAMAQGMLDMATVPDSARQTGVSVATVERARRALRIHARALISGTA